jgi:hypothetical protein
MARWRRLAEEIAANGGACLKEQLTRQAGWRPACHLKTLGNFIFLATQLLLAASHFSPFLHWASAALAPRLPSSRGRWDNGFAQGGHRAIRQRA